MSHADWSPLQLIVAVRIAATRYKSGTRGEPSAGIGTPTQQEAASKCQPFLGGSGAEGVRAAAKGDMTPMAFAALGCLGFFASRLLRF
jgi:hypothetical protein